MSSEERENGLCTALQIRIHIAKDSIVSDNSITLALYAFLSSALSKMKIIEELCVCDYVVRKKKLLKASNRNC